MSRDDEFVRETRASVRELTNGLVELERDGRSREQVDELFRTAHTLKGNCSMAGLDGASRIAHAVEDFLSSLRDESLTPTPELIDAALAAVDDIDALLEARDDESATTDPDSAVTTLREEMDRHRDEAGTPPEWADEPTDSPSAEADDPPAEFDQTVVDALESASGFDDLEGLLAEMDDPEETAGQEESRWGTFDRTEQAEPASDESPPTTGEPDAVASSDPDESDSETLPADVDPSSESMNEFDAIKNDVQTDDVTSLDRELVDVEFGEFDHDDELSIQELIDGELAGPNLSDDDAAADTGGHPTSSADAPDTPGRDDTIRPEDFGYESVVHSTPDEANPFEGIDVVDPEEATAADAGHEADTDAVEADAGDGESTEPSVEADAGDGESTEPSVEADDSSVESEATADSSPSGPTPGPAAADDEPAVSGSDGETPGPPVDDADIPEASAERPEDARIDEDARPDEATAGTPAFSETFTEDDGGPTDEISVDDFPDEFDADDAGETSDELGIGDVFGADDTGDSPDDGPAEETVGEGVPEDLSGPFAEDDSPGDEISDDDFPEDGTDTFEDDIVPPEFDDGLDLPEDFLSGSMDLGGEEQADDVATGSDDIEVATESRVDDLDLPDIDLPDVDDLTGIGRADEGDAGSTAADVSFERDEHTMAFESRFAERFGGQSDEDKVQLVQVASSTIEESSLDAARYQSSGAADYPLDFGETRESDRIQSLTVDVENADSLLNLVEELSLTQLRIKQSDDEDVDDHLSVMDSVTGELRRAVMNLRLMPLSTAVDGLPRVVRDIARKQDKEVAFEVSDEGVDLDRSIVEKIGDPLVHLVRNAVDHGIEPPEERVQQGKPREGTIELRAWRDRERVVIEVEDDGRGISAERIRQQAIDHDIISRGRAERMSFDEVYDLVFEPGFSTADEVTDVSGRGVGMDAVRRTVNSLDGTVDIESEPGAGTTVRIRLPVSVAVSKMLFVGVGPEQYAIPASAVADVELVDEADLGDDGTVAVEWPEEVSDRPGRISYRRLSEELGVDTAGDARPDGKRVLVRLDPDAWEFALVCDEVDDAREVVVKPYEKLLGEVPGISGATMSGDGTLVNIIDVTTL